MAQLTNFKQVVDVFERHYNEWNSNNECKPVALLTRNNNNYRVQPIDQRLEILMQRLHEFLNGSNIISRDLEEHLEALKAAKPTVKTISDCGYLGITAENSNRLANASANEIGYWRPHEPKAMANRLAGLVRPARDVGGQNMFDFYRAAQMLVLALHGLSRRRTYALIGAHPELV